MNRFVETRVSDRLKGINIYLIGMMGAGKSTVGKQVAQRLGYQFFDTDTVIEQLAGQSIPELFVEMGEAGFRDLESRVLAELSTYTRLVVATGGGIILRQENWGYLRYGVIAWLDVPLEQIQQRLQADTARPLLQNGDLASRLQTLMEQRRSLYAQADVHVGYEAGDTPEQVAERVLLQVGQVLKPEPNTEDNGN
ncbi:MAG: shikimate kinase [Oscillatoriales cyanobacterium C42_A2020_001]|nr:shikimate kinase [Leptolyngbyaceae cyanobacterium C42_A2020_001]